MKGDRFTSTWAPWVDSSLHGRPFFSRTYQKDSEGGHYWAAVEVDSMGRAWARLYLFDVVLHHDGPHYSPGASKGWADEVASRYRYGCKWAPEGASV